MFQKSATENDALLLFEVKETTAVNKSLQPYSVRLCSGALK